MLMSLINALDWINPSIVLHKKGDIIYLMVNHLNKFAYLRTGQLLYKIFTHIATCLVFPSGFGTKMENDIVSYELSWSHILWNCATQSEETEGDQPSRQVSLITQI